MSLLDKIDERPDEGVANTIGWWHAIDAETMQEVHDIIKRFNDNDPQIRRKFGSKLSLARFLKENLQLSITARQIASYISCQA